MPSWASRPAPSLGSCPAAEGPGGRRRIRSPVRPSGPARSPRSGTTELDPASCTSRSTITPAWPTPRSCPTRRARPVRGFSTGRSAASPSTASPDRAADDRQRLGLPVLATRNVRPTRHPSGIHPTLLPWQNGNIERLNAPFKPSGPTDMSSPAAPPALPPLRPGSSSTTLTGATAHSQDSHTSAACYSPDDSVYLGISWVPGAVSLQTHHGRQLGSEGAGLGLQRTVESGGSDGEGVDPG